LFFESFEEFGVPLMQPLSRYDRQTRLPGIGLQGQQRIRQSRVAVLGCGALGTVAADILARAGVGTLRLIDRDVVEWTNLQRQSLYYESDAETGRAKAEVACERLSQANSSVDYQPLVADVHADNITSILTDIDLVIDATDNFNVRFLLNDFSLRFQIPWVHGGCVGTTGQVMFFTGSGKPCFRCLVPEPPPASAIATCDTAGVLGSATHAVASLQATEAIKWITGNRDVIRTGVWSLDFWHNRSREIAIPEALSASCPACGRGELTFLDATDGDVSGGTKILCGRNSVQIGTPAGRSADLATLAKSWHDLGTVQTTKFFVRLTLPEDFTITVFRDGRTLIDGTNDVGRAKSIYARYVGN
jgi:molybdopterin/thiamine biosynthesis adenylyltransferase